MINPIAIKNLFNPFKFERLSFSGFLEVLGMSERDFYKICFQDECSKATDESCVNTECPHNYLKMHESELYIELIQEIQAERKAVEDKTKRDMEKYYGKS